MGGCFTKMIFLLSSSTMLFIALGNFTQGKTIQVKRCDNNQEETQVNQTLIQVRVTPCEQEPCVFKPGSNGLLEIDFSPAQNYTSIEAELTANILGLRNKLILIRHNACNGKYGLVCPLIKGSKYTYKYTFHVAKLSPKLTTQLKWKLMQESGNIILCFVMVAKVS